MYNREQAMWKQPQSALIFNCPKVLNKEKHLPVSCCFGQFVLRLPVMCVQPEHEAASAQLGLWLLQLLRQVKHLACGVVRILTNTHTHTQKPIHAQFDNKSWTTDFPQRTRLFCRMTANLCNKLQEPQWMKRSLRRVCLRWGHVFSGKGN